MSAPHTSPRHPANIAIIIMMVRMGWKGVFLISFFLLLFSNSLQFSRLLFIDILKAFFYLIKFKGGEGCREIIPTIIAF